MRSIQFPRARMTKGIVRFIYVDDQGQVKMFQTTTAHEADFFKCMIYASCNFKGPRKSKTTFALPEAAGAL